MRITNHQRERIAPRVVASVFNPKKEAHKIAGQKLAVQVRDKILSFEQREAIDALPKDFFKEYRINVTTDGSNHIQLPCPDGVRFPYFMVCDRVVGLPEGRSNKLIDRLMAWCDEAVELAKEEKAFFATVRGTLFAISTEEKLDELMPEVRRLMGENFFTPPPVRQLPVATANTINDKLKKALKEAA